MASDNHTDSEAAARQHASESSDDGIVSIRSADYDHIEAALAADPIIREMAADLPEGFDTKAWSFTTAALHEYATGIDLEPHHPSDTD